MRNIDDILLFRGDISPFLVHLTKRSNGSSAKDILEKIIADRKVLPGNTLVSDIRYGGFTTEMSDDDMRKYFAAACFTETPLDEIHCLLEISYRQINLEPYGLVFLKERLKLKSVSPVLYINNESGDKNNTVRTLFNIIDASPGVASNLLPLFAVFGVKIQHPGAQQAPIGRVDFRWEREWRQPYSKGGVPFDETDLFVGICPHEEIDYFEGKLPGVCFVDPRRPMKWYATKLVHSRQRVNLKFSVV